jgi:hypothetical protein
MSVPIETFPVRRVSWHTSAPGPTTNFLFNYLVIKALPYNCTRTLPSSHLPSILDISSCQQCIILKIIINKTRMIRMRREWYSRCFAIQLLCYCHHSIRCLFSIIQIVVIRISLIQFKQKSMMIRPFWQSSLIINQLTLFHNLVLSVTRLLLLLLISLLYYVSGLMIYFIRLWLP